MKPFIQDNLKAYLLRPLSPDMKRYIERLPVRFELSRDDVKLCRSVNESKS